MRVAIVGLATSHPFSDARVLRRLGCDVHVSRDAGGVTPARLEDFQAMHDVEAVPTDHLLHGRPDLAIVTVTPTRASATIARMLAAGIPAFVNKPAVANPEQLQRLDDVVRAHDVPVLTCSVLRFAPAFDALQALVDPADVLSCRATVRHDIGAYRDPQRRWQDQPNEGGGNLFALGLHGVDVLSRVIGAPTALDGIVSARRHHAWTASEDVGVAVGRFGGLPATIEFLGAAPSPTLEIAVHGPHATTRCAVDETGSDPDRDTGMLATMEAALAMAVEGTSPIPWAESRAVLGFAMAMAGRPPPSPSHWETTT